MIATTTSASNREKLARSKRQYLNRPGWIETVIAESKKLAKTLEGSSDTELREHTDQLRKHIRTDSDLDDTRIVVLAAAGVIRAVRQVLGMQLFDAQLHAGIIVSRGAVAEMQTGEGKTLSVALPAYFRSLHGRGVHVATPNSYLAARDRDQLAPVFAMLGATTGLLTEDATPAATRAAYRADITYGPGHAFGFDYLRDQLTLDRFHSSQLGHSIYSELLGIGAQDEMLQRGLYASIIDEIDHVLIDDAVSPLLLSGSGPGESPDADLHRAAKVTAEQLNADVDYHVLSADAVHLTELGFANIYRNDKMAVHPSLVRPWHEYIVLALRAMHSYRRDVHFVVRNNKVQIVDVSTGRILEDRSWSDGLHQAVEARENLEISCENLPLARITRQRFYRYYESLAGMTGTATGCEHEFEAVYGIPVSLVPLRVPTQRTVLPDHVSLTREEKLNAIAAECEAMIESGRAALIGTLSIAESIEVAEQLTSRGLDFQLLNGVQDADEAAIIASAGRRGAITVATNLAGRGTDIALDPEVAQNGGLHVVVTQQHLLARVDRQLIGRCARCGDPGSTRTFISADDAISKDLAPWIGRAIERWEMRGRPTELVLGSPIRRIQAGQQQQASAHRWRMLQADREDEKLLAKSGESPERCFAL
jgi:preprotein translocase subunit SecA